MIVSFGDVGVKQSSAAQQSRHMSSAEQTQASVLLVEDDERLAPLVQRHLQQSGFGVEWVKTAAEADDAFGRSAFDVAILDLMLPGEDGLSYCRRLRSVRDVGIIIVTARGADADRIMGLCLGSDDYLTKPFSLWELEARVRAVLRRYVRTTRPGRANAGLLALDLAQRTAMLAGEMLDLTRSEFDILALMTAQPGVVFSRERLLEAIQGGGSDAYDRAVDTHISNLRRKLERNPRAANYIKTVWGVGYRLEPK